MAEIIEMPKLSDTMTAGTLIKWLKSEGDSVSAGDMIAEVETDKATMEVEVFEDGVMLKHYVSEGDAVPIGGPICAIGEEGEDVPEAEVKTADPDEIGDGEDEEDDASEDESEDESESKSKKKKDEDSADAEDSEEEDDEDEDKDEEDGEEESSEESAPVPTPKRADGERLKVSPLARKIAKELGVDLSYVEGSGPGGRILKADVEKASKAPKPAKKASKGSAPSGPAFKLGSIEEKTEKVSNMRSSIAKALVKSKTEAPHFYLQSEVDAAALATIRQDLNSFLADIPADAGGIKYTVNDLILKAAAMAAIQVPEINRSWQGKKIKQFGAVHLAFGVAVDEGLVTPVIRDADSKTLRQISEEAKSLIKKARDRKLKPDEMSGSTLTVTNLGMFGISDFYGIINPNNAAILSVGATVKKPVVDDNDHIVVGYRMKVGLSGDHRVIDGAVGAQYLDALRRILEKPSILLA